MSNNEEKYSCEKSENDTIEEQQKKLKFILEFKEESLNKYKKLYQRQIITQGRHIIKEYITRDNDK